MTPGHRLPAALFLLLASLISPVAAVAGQLSLTWGDASGGGVGFSVERSVGVTGPFAVLSTTEPGVTTYVDTTVADATTYCYRVQAFNASAFSEYSGPACATSVPAAIAVTLSVNRHAFTLGEPLRIEMSVTNGGPPAILDIYWGAILPSDPGPATACLDGDAAVAYATDARAGLGGVVVGCVSGLAWTGIPLYEGVRVTRELIELFGFDWPPATPGNYMVFVAVTYLGATDVIALGTATVTYAP